IEVNTGDLLLTPGVLTKFKNVIKRFGVNIETLYSEVPQTQQSALDEGLKVRRRPPTPKRFTPGKILADAYKDLDLPFEKLETPVIAEDKVGTISKLSVTLEDGTRKEVQHTPNLSSETVYYRQTLRSGQVLEANGNIVVVGDAHSGSEILADGDIL